MPYESGCNEAPLIVSGMHRCGTSLTASLLAAGGVDMGARLMPPNFGNPRGYYENLDFVHFHESLLVAAGDNPAGWKRSTTTPLSDLQVARARELVRENRVDGLWGWKDPRTTLFADFWSSFLPNAHFIFLYRAPWEIVDSLFRRGSDEVFTRNPELAVDATLEYFSRIIAFASTHANRCLVANVSAIVADPAKLFTEIYARFGISVFLPEPAPIYADEIHSDGLEHRAAFVESELPSLAGAFRQLEAVAAIPGVSRTPARTIRSLSDWQHASSPRRGHDLERRHFEAVGAFLAIGRDVLAIECATSLTIDELRRNANSLIVIERNAYDGVSLPAADSSIDVAFLDGAVANVIERPALLADIDRILRPDGLLVVLMPRGDVDSAMISSEQALAVSLHRYFPLVESYMHNRSEVSLLRNTERDREYAIACYTADDRNVSRGLARVGFGTCLLTVCGRRRLPQDISSLLVQTSAGT